MGRISHKGVLSDGQHEAIIDPKVWQKVQEMLQAHNARERDQPNAAISSPLAGIIFDEQGERLTPSHAVKSGRRYWYKHLQCPCARAGQHQRDQTVGARD